MSPAYWSGRVAAHQEQVTCPYRSEADLRDWDAGWWDEYLGIPAPEPEDPGSSWRAVAIVGLLIVTGLVICILLGA